MSMTRGQMKTRIRGLFREAVGTTGAGDPFSIDWNVSSGADDTARATNCFSGTVHQDVVANQPAYSPPNLISITGAFIIDSTLKRTPLIEITAENLTRLNPTWRDDVPGTPTHYITRAATSLVLWPTPKTSSLVQSYTDLVAATAYSFSSVAHPFASGGVGSYLTVATAIDSGFTNGPNRILSVAGGIATMEQPVGTASSAGGIATLSNGGLYVEGLAIPGDTWPNDIDLCPLPSQHHEAVMWRAAMLRCRQFPVEYAANLPGIEIEWKRAKGHAEAETVRQTQGTRGGVPIRRDRGGW